MKKKELMVSWTNTATVQKTSFRCSYCDFMVGSTLGYLRDDCGPDQHVRKIMICPHCENPTFFNDHGLQIPGNIVGENVAEIKDDLTAKLYSEARKCATAGAYTACILTCREIVASVAVSLKADQGKSFSEYVGFLEKKGYIQETSKVLIREIQKQGNQTGNRIQIMNLDHALLFLDFIATLIRSARLSSRRPQD